MINAANKGKQAERDVASYFTQRGIELRRHVRTGTQYEPDEGDLRGDGFTIECKNHGGDLSYGSVGTYLRKLTMVQKRPGDIGILVERLDRIGAHRAGEWRAWTTAEDAARLLTDPQASAVVYPTDPHHVCFRLETVVTRLLAIRAAGGPASVFVPPAAQENPFLRMMSGDAATLIGGQY
jgi:hypothetical protein